MTLITSHEHIACRYSTCLGLGKSATVDFAVVFYEKMGLLFGTWRPPSAGIAIGAVNFCLPQVPMTLITSREHIACRYSTYLGNGKSATVDFAVVFSEEMGPFLGHGALPRPA